VSLITSQKISLTSIYIWLLVIILAGIFIHAPLSVGLGSVFPQYELLIKSWKEILMLVAGVILLVILFTQKRLKLLQDKIIGIVLLYALLHLGLLSGNLEANLAGLAIDLRYVFYFSLVYLAIKLDPRAKGYLIKTAIIGALVVGSFAILQVFFLPADILKYIGYGNATIAPYLTIDLNESYIRINSTLRGPNPLGALAVVGLALLTAFLLKSKKSSIKKNLKLIILLGFGGLIALWHSYSRSAFLALAVAIFIVGVIAINNPRILIESLKKHKNILLSSLALVLITLVLVFSDQQFVSNVIWHENPNESNSLNSNEGHVSSLAEGWQLFADQPFGAGVGSTGSASLFTDKAIIIENQYLFIAHEVGWLGLGIFVWLFVVVLLKLWQNKSNWLSAGLFASGVGLSIIGLLLPVWVDDTVAIVWWGLVAVAISTKAKASIINL